MLQQFSWGAFLIASIVLNLVWYVFVLLVFYRKEMLAFVGGRTSGTVRHAGWQQNRFRSEGAAGGAVPGRGDGAVVGEGELMGGSRLPEGVQVRSSSQMVFSSNQQMDRSEQVGLVADVVQELKVLFSELEASGGGKAEFFGRVSVLKEEFGGIGGHPSLGAINGFIRERALFPISDRELEELWF